MNIIDCKGLACPMPVIKTKKYFDLEDSKETLVIVDNEVAKNNILRLAKGLKLNSSFEEENGLYTIQLSKGEFTKIGLKIGDIDPRLKEIDNYTTISDKARNIGGGVLEALLMIKYKKGI